MSKVDSFRRASRAGKDLLVRNKNQLLDKRWGKSPGEGLPFHFYQPGPTTGKGFWRKDFLLNRPVMFQRVPSDIPTSRAKKRRKSVRFARRNNDSPTDSQQSHPIPVFRNAESGARCAPQRCDGTATGAATGRRFTPFPRTEWWGYNLSFDYDSEWSIRHCAMHKT